MGNISCSWWDRDKRIHHAIEASLKEIKHDILECIRSELTASRSQESDGMNLANSIELPMAPPVLLRQASMRKSAIHWNDNPQPR